MDRYAESDGAAFGEVYDLWAPPLFGYLRRLVHRPSDVEDFVHGLALGLRDRTPPRHRRAPPRQTRPALGARRRRARVGVSSEASPLAHAEAREVSRIVARAFEGLPEPQQVAFRLLEVEGLSIAEAAELLGTTETGVKLRAHRAYEHLRPALAHAARGQARLDGRSTGA